MTAGVALRRPPRPSAAPSLFDDPVGGEPTLEQLLTGVWDELAAAGSGVCPVCGGGEMRAQYGAHAQPIGGRCGACGSALT